MHNDGEIYGAIGWSMMTRFGDARRADLFRYLVDGMNYTPSRPTYEDMRRGILASIQAGGVLTDCGMVWQAFAQFGVGFGSSAVVNSDGTVTVTESNVALTSCTEPQP